MTLRLVSGAVLFAAGLAAEHIVTALPGVISSLLFIAAYIILGYDIVLSACRNILKGRIFDENFLMSVASIGAFLVGEHPEAAAVMLFYQIGEKLQDMAVDKSRRSITELMDLRPDYVSIEENGEIKRVNPELVKIGTTIVVKQGEKIALDGVVSNGSTYLDTSALTGESVPRKAEEGDEVLSGSVNTASTIHVRVTKSFSDSTVSKILDMVENAQDKKSQSEKFITTFAKYYTPIVCAAALLVMLIPSIVTGDVKTWIYRGLTFLVVSCPCALVVSIPLGFFAGLGCASKNKILIKGSNYLEMLSHLQAVVMDKTGTLTEGEFKVIKATDDAILKTAAYAEFYSDHPIAASIKSAYGKQIDYKLISDYTEISGKGISANIGGAHVLAGNKRLMEQFGISVSDPNEDGTAIYIAENKKYMGCLIIADEIKADSKSAVSLLNGIGIRTVMLTGDKKEPAEAIAAKLGISEVHSELLPQDKVKCIEDIISSSPENSYTAFVGDGINDAPVLARADIGIAMGGIGADSAIEAADVVLMDDKPSRIYNAIKISRHTLGIIKQNIVFAIGIKIIIMILSALGLANMWLAIFGDVGVALLAVLNSMRALHIKTISE